ncbi:MAG: hypothetical protein IID15_01195, partial [Candidatus Marinimicrobia bacterium]|nr:hypothetical protein [Candidatus Neomarinimicrobiota bacterium]
MNQRPKIRAHQLRYLTLTVFIIGCMAKDTGDIDEIVAVVNGDSITRRDFILRIEMTILPGNDRWADRNERLLNIMIDELVVGQWAEQEEFELPPAYDEQLQFITQQASIRELYRLEFENLPEVDSVLIVQAVEKSSTELSIQTMFTESEGISMDWQEATNQGQTFSELLTGGSQNPAIHIGQSTIRWGDGDVPEKIEALAYSM